MKRILLVIIIVLSIASVSKAQDFKNAIGLRAGFSSGLTFKHFKDQKVALEGLFTTRWQGFDITGLYEVHNQALDVKRLKWYYGGGAHIGFYDGDHTRWGYEGINYTVVGIDGVIGLEYAFSGAPFNIGIDWKPAFNLVGYQGFWSEGAISIRFCF